MFDESSTKIEYISSTKIRFITTKIVLVLPIRMCSISKAKSVAKYAGDKWRNVVQWENISLWLIFQSWLTNTNKHNYLYKDYVQTLWKNFAEILFISAIDFALSTLRKCLILA